MKDCKADGYGHNLNELPCNKKSAEAIGCTYFCTGKECKYGHKAARFTKGGNCVVCSRVYQALRRGVPLDKAGRYANNNAKRLTANSNRKKTYIPEHPCKRGHKIRWTSSNNCVKCDSIQKEKRRESAKFTRIKKEYGLSKEEYVQLFLDQEYRCAICDIHESETHSLHVDHCHKTKKVRGLLCNRCNQGIGLLRDDATIIEKAMEYIKNGS